MVPEAGGSSSFARRAFNEFVSFGAGWALMLDYIVTVAISAFFVPNYLAVFWPALKTQPYNGIGGIVTIAFLVVINVIGIKEAARLNIVLALLDLATQVLLMIIGVVLLLEPSLLIDQVQLGRRADVVPPHLRHLDRHHRLHGHRDRLEHGRGGGQPRPRRAARDQLRARRGAGRVPRHLDDRALGHARQVQRAPVRRREGQDGARRGRRQERGRAERALRVRGDAAAGQRRPRRLRPRRREGRRAGTPTSSSRRATCSSPRWRPVHEAVRVAARQRLPRGPGGRHRPLHARRTRLAASRSSCPGSASSPRRSC